MTKEDCRHGVYLTSISVLREFVRRSGHTGTEELHIGIVSTADLRLHLVLKVAATAHTSVSSRSRRKCTASMQDLQYRQLVHPHRRTSLHLCAGISGNRQQLEVGAETPRRDSLDGDEGRSCLCSVACLTARPPRCALRLCTTTILCALHSQSPWAHPAWRDCGKNNPPGLPSILGRNVVYTAVVRRLAVRLQSPHRSPRRLEVSTRFEPSSQRRQCQRA